MSIVISSLGKVIYGPNIVRDGLISYQDGSNITSLSNGSSSWYDLTPNQNNCILYNTSYNGNGWINLATTSSDHVYGYISNNPTIDFTDALTIDMWINHSGVSNHCGIIYKGGLVNDQGVYSIVYYNNKLYARLNGLTDKIEGVGNVQPNRWYNIVFTYNKSEMVLYQNNIIIGQANYSSSINVITNHLMIGLYYSSGYSFTGSIANIKLYNRALSQSEISQNYGSIKGRFGL